MFLHPAAAEADIENLDVVAIERQGGETVLIRASGSYDIWLRCTLRKHKELVARFRQKLGLKNV